jgi:acetyltransferase-like isoleucine patch superfamily enzyme
MAGAFGLRKGDEMTSISVPPAKARRRGLNRLLALRSILMGVRRFYFTKLWGMDIHPTAQFSSSADFDRTFPIGVHIGAETLVAFQVKILTHDMTRGLYLHTRIGARCFIGGRRSWWA